MELRPLWKSGHRVQFFQNHKTKLWKKEYVLGTNTAIDGWNSGPFSGKNSDMILHTMKVFLCAIAVMTQLCIQNGEPLATVSYKE